MKKGHWSYGAFRPAQGQRPFITQPPVQTDKTKEALVELDKELCSILGKQPISERELSTGQKNQTLQLPGRWETDDAVGNSDDYFTTYPPESARFR